jgi:hypothetical protein
MRGRYFLAQAALGTIGVLLAVMAQMFVAGPSWAGGIVQVYPPAPIGLQLSTGVATPGTTIQVTGEGCPAGSTVRIYLGSTSALLTTTVASGQGTISVTITIPLSAVPGQTTVVAKCSSVTLSAVLDIVSSTTYQRPLPGTGFDTRTPLLAGLALIVFGSVTVLSARVRRLRGAPSRPGLHFDRVHKGNR